MRAAELNVSEYLRRTVFTGVDGIAHAVDPSSRAGMAPALIKLPDGKSSYVEEITKRLNRQLMTLGIKVGADATDGEE